MTKKMFITTLIILFCTGCATNSHEKEREVPPEELAEFLDNKPEHLHSYYEALIRQGKRNHVLNRLRIGHVAAARGEYELAARQFDQAIDNIETIYAENPEAEKARSTFVKENYKDFKGQPHERAMAYLYRGLLYLMEDDYENARASFKGGQLQDALAEDQKYASDFASLEFLEGWASMCNGDDAMAEEAFSRAVSLNSRLVPPDSDHSVLHVHEVDIGPSKVAEGEHSEKLTYAKRSLFDAGGSLQVDVWMDEVSPELVKAEDLYWQATTRGGREVDAIIEGKATFKENAQDTAGALAAGSMAATQQAIAYNDPDMANLGGAMAVASLFSSALAASAKPEADTRYWDSLPGYIYVGTSERVVPEEGVAQGYRLTDGNGKVLSQIEGEYFGQIELDSNLEIPSEFRGVVSHSDGSQYDYTTRLLTGADPVDVKARSYRKSEDGEELVWERVLSEKEVLAMAGADEAPCSLAWDKSAAVYSLPMRAPNSSELAK